MSRGRGPLVAGAGKLCDVMWMSRVPVSERMLVELGVNKGVIRR